MIDYNFCWEQFDNTNSISVIETDETYNLNEKIENIEELVKVNKIKYLTYSYNMGVNTLLYLQDFLINTDYERNND